MAKISREMVAIILDGEINPSFSRYLQVREALIPELDKGKYPIRVDISWFYNGDKNGLPDLEVQEAFEQFENAVVPVLEKDKLALLAYQLTGEGQRMWCFYTRNLSAFEECLNDATEQLPLFPLELYAERDAELDAFHEVLSLLN